MLVLFCVVDGWMNLLGGGAGIGGGTVCVLSTRTEFHFRGESFSDAKFPVIRENPEVRVST